MYKPCKIGSKFTCREVKLLVPYRGPALFQSEYESPSLSKFTYEGLLEVNLLKYKYIYFNVSKFTYIEVNLLTLK